MSIFTEYSSLFLSEYTSSWCIALFAITGYFTYYFHEVAKKPFLACSDGKYKQYLIENMPILKEKFWPTFWCCESRLQTIFGHYIRKIVISENRYKRTILRLSDGGEVALDWNDNFIVMPSNEHNLKDLPIIVALPGLTGSSDVEYMVNLALNLAAVGIRCVVFNNRGLAGIPLKTARAYCASNVDDIFEVMEHVRKTNPEVKIGVLGVSMGGLIVANYLATRSGDVERQNLSAAMLISPPWNIFLGTESIEKPYLNAILNRELASNLVNTFNRVRVMFEGRAELDLDCTSVTLSKSVREFDSRFTTKIFGYANVHEYYKAASIHEKVPAIAATRVPTLCLSAADDPFQPLEGIPVDAAENSDSVAILVTNRGGHIGFMDGVLPPFITTPRNHYMQRVITQFFTAVFSEPPKI